MRRVLQVRRRGRAGGSSAARAAGATARQVLQMRQEPRRGRCCRCGRSGTSGGAADAAVLQSRSFKRLQRLRASVASGHSGNQLPTRLFGRSAAFSEARITVDRPDNSPKTRLCRVCGSPTPTPIPVDRHLSRVASCCVRGTGSSAPAWQNISTGLVEHRHRPGRTGCSTQTSSAVNLRGASTGGFLLLPLPAAGGPPCHSCAEQFSHLQTSRRPPSLS